MGGGRHRGTSVVRVLVVLATVVLAHRRWTVPTAAAAANTQANTEYQGQIQCIISTPIKNTDSISKIPIPSHFLVHNGKQI